LRLNVGALRYFRNAKSLESQRKPAQARSPGETRGSPACLTQRPAAIGVTGRFDYIRRAKGTGATPVATRLPQRLEPMPDTAPTDHAKAPAGSDFTEADEPIRLFAAWFEEAKRTEPADPEAMALATVDADGLPNVRMVLLKGFDARGFVFYTNESSQKGHEIAAHPKGAFAFHWKSLRRQVRLRGTIAAVADAEADAYFASRPRSAQIGAWASKQSSPLESRLAFEKAIAVHAAKFALGAVPRPPFWVGYRLIPVTIEFWQDRPYRLHDRIEFRRADPGATGTLAGTWIKTRLYP
jgi:pyridoxamine 5'-phosphate oxidase